MSAVTEAGRTPVPEDLPDVFAEFCAAGLWPGLGPRLAGRLAAAGITGPAEVSAQRLELVEGVGGRRAVALAAAFGAARPVYETARLLVACRVPARLAGPAVARLGATAPQQLREDPWRLLAVPQLRPDQADWFARQVLGGQAGPEDPRRGRALAGHLLARAARDGHTAVPAAVVAGALGRFRISDPAAAITAAVDDGGVLPFEPPEPGPGADDGFAGDGPAGEAGAGDGPGHDGPGEDGTGDVGPGTADGMLLALARYALAEEAVAEGVQRLAALAEPLEADERPGAAGEGAEGAGAGEAYPLDAVQQQAVQAVTEHGVSVLCGGPGTGKSRTVAAVVAMAQARGLRVALAAPTGRAAKRLEELAGAPATTVHRLLGAQTNGFTWSFARNEEAPIEADLVVVDEASMLDAELAAALAEACPDGARLLLVGDPAQLPSIGPGRVLADLIDSGAVPVTELTRLYRQRAGGVIARLATAVRDGTLPAVDAPDREVVVVPVRGSAEAARRVTQLVTDSIPRALGIPAGEVQVITPVHKGAAGTVELNRALKARLNPGPGARGGFDPGDRVVAVANHPDEGFANGEVGTVTAAGQGGLVIEFPSGPVTVPDRLLGDLRHGWALTVHRAQGSEWPAVVAVFPAEAAGLLSRPLAYTALTRAQRHLSVVHGAGPALARAVATVGEQPRVTRLASLLG
jgi:exodeoxyribonuclease V alpha subunit